MLSRHFLRAKVLQTIYAGVSGDTAKTQDLVKMFDYNIDKLNDLGVMILSMLPQITWTEDRVMEAAQQKFRPSEEERRASRKLADNMFISRIESGFEYRKYTDRMHIDWSNHYDTFRKLLASVKESKLYKEYMQTDDRTFEEDKDFALALFRFSVNDKTLREIIFDNDLLWEDDFDQIAQYVFMMLKELNEDNLNEATPCVLVYDSRNEKERIDVDFARQLIVDTYNNIEDTETLFRKHLQIWDMERVAMMDIMLINMAVTEFTCCPSIPERVTVDEYIELSKEFSTDKSKLFINGILDKILIELRVAGRVQKDERGLYDPTVEGEPSVDSESGVYSTSV